jgi:hypothetical protein
MGAFGLYWVLSHTIKYAPGGSAMVRSIVSTIRGSVGEMKNTSGIMRFAASNASVPKYCTNVPRFASQPRVITAS